jgi:hypothetical protein
MEVSGQLHGPPALPPGKEPWYPLDKRLYGAQNRVYIRRVRCPNYRGLFEILSPYFLRNCAELKEITILASYNPAKIGAVCVKNHTATSNPTVNPVQKTGLWVLKAAGKFKSGFNSKVLITKKSDFITWLYHNTRQSFCFCTDCLSRIQMFPNSALKES